MAFVPGNRRPGVTRFIALATAGALSLGLAAVSVVPAAAASSTGPVARTETGATLAADTRPRMIITQDGEVDDMDSFIRYLYYSNEFDTAGIIYSSSTYHYSGNGVDVAPFRWTGTAWLSHYIDLYEQIYPNLIKHADGYPTPDYLRSIYKIGNVTNVSEMTQVTEGSEWVKNVILDDDTRPLYVQAWGGLNTVARALKSIEEQYSGTPQWAAIQAKVNSKVVVYNILNQDSTLNGYIKPTWPNIPVIDNQSQFWSFAYMWTSRVPAHSQYVLRAPYMEANYLNGTGPLMAEYRTYRDGMPTPGDDQNNRWRVEQSNANQNMGYDIHDFISEGDSPAFMYLIDNGLRSLENPTWGGWGGRFAVNATGWIDTTDYSPYSTNSGNMRAYPLVRWVEDIQNDFAGRVAWGTASSYAAANHNPVANVTNGLDLNLKAGATAVIDATATDPDGDAVTVKWWQYTDPGSYPGEISFSSTDTASTSFTVPADAQPGQTIHAIMEVTDDGTPAMKHYQRVVVTVVGSYTPTVTSQYPDAVSTTGTTPVVLTGSELFEVTGVQIDGGPVVPVTVGADGQSIEFIAPARESAGSAAVTLCSGSTAVGMTSLVYAAPTITGVSPDRGPVAGGTEITISGTDLATATQVLIDGKPATGLVAAADGTSLRVITPKGTAGAALVTVVLPGADASASGAYTYAQVAIDRTPARVVQGESVAVTVSGLGAGEAAVLWLDGTASRLADLTADASGVAVAQVSVPLSTAAGVHSLRVVGALSGEASASLRVVAVELPITGAPVELDQPLYRFYKNDGTHFYTTSAFEADQVKRYAEYTYEGIAGFIGDGTVPGEGQTALHRFYKVDGTHFYTASDYEASLVKTYREYTYEGVVGIVDTAKSPANTEMYRFYKTAAGTHFFTSSAYECNLVKSYPQYKYENVAFYLSATS